jgi:hydroxymethylglutaryl-CoA synthase
MSVGIEHLYTYAPQYALPLDALAEARGVAPEKLTRGLGVQAMAVPPACEDVVTLAATAGARCLRAAGVDPREIGLLVVATETGVDHSKPVGIFVHELLGVGPHCRV